MIKESLKNYFYSVYYYGTAQNWYFRSKPTYRQLTKLMKDNDIPDTKNLEISKHYFEERV